MQVSRGLLAATVVLGGVVAVGAADTQPRGWSHDFYTAQAQARAAGKPLLLHFHASWCGPCKKMDAETLSSGPLLGQLGRRVIGVKVDSDRHPELVARFGITALPSDLFITADGRVISKSQGYQDSRTYLARVADIGSRYYVPPTPAQPAVIVAVAEMPAVSEKPGKVVGLRGFSPVALTGKRQWVHGSPEFAWRHNGIVYYLASATELAAFQADPDRFAPQLLGCDPLILSAYDRAVPGAYKYAAFAEGRLYLFYSENNRANFGRNPRQYLSKVQTPKLEDVELTQAD